MFLLLDLNLAAGLFSLEPAHWGPSSEAGAWGCWLIWPFSVFSGCARPVLLSFVYEKKLTNQLGNQKYWIFTTITNFYQFNFFLMIFQYHFSKRINKVLVHAPLSFGWLPLQDRGFWLSRGAAGRVGFGVVATAFRGGRLFQETAARCRTGTAPACWGRPSCPRTRWTSRCCPATIPSGAGCFCRSLAASLSV